MTPENYEKRLAELETLQAHYEALAIDAEIGKDEQAHYKSCAERTADQIKFLTSKQEKK